MLKVREASLQDVPAILEIYRPYIIETPITYETEVPSLGDFQKRFLEITQKYPWIVCEKDHRVIGYAYVNSFKGRQAYDWTVESTVYVDQDYRGQGVGFALYQRLIEICKELGFVSMIGGISLPNPPSVALHERMGFLQVAHLKNLGYKLGQWWDVGYWQLELAQPAPKNPVLPKFRNN